MITYYHVSKARFHRGDIVRPGVTEGAAGRTENCAVFLNTEAAPHETIAAVVAEDPAAWFIYEVEPLSTPIYDPDNRDYRCRSARVVARLGSAYNQAHRYPRGTRPHRGDSQAAAGRLAHIHRTRGKGKS